MKLLPPSRSSSSGPGPPEWPPVSPCARSGTGALFERYREARPAGNILNLWPPPIKALQAMGVDTVDLGAPCHTSFRGVKGNIRADVKIPEEVMSAFGGGFIGLLRPELYRRMLAAMPEGVLHTNSRYWRGGQRR